MCAPAAGRTAARAGSRSAADGRCGPAPSASRRRHRGSERARACAPRRDPGTRRRAPRRAVRAPARTRSSRRTAAADGASARRGTAAIAFGSAAAASSALARQVELARRSGAHRAEEVAIRLLARMREPPLERMDEDRGPSVDDRERIAPQPQRQTEPEVGGEQRVRPLARQVGSRARNAEADRVERLAERASAFLRPAQQRLGMGDGRRPGERRRDAARGGTARSARRRTAPGSAPNTCRSGERTSRSTDSSSYG